ncbi:hypothetical protein N6H14_14700 [Paenibacillus sp. CC-CFT747]|nr:hypothetical protein N6H14_14700 [Paenibacillus sp. CC-CFT747]
MEKDTVQLGDRLQGTVYHHRGFKVRIKGFEQWTCSITLEKDEQAPLEGEERAVWVTGLTLSTRTMHVSLSDYGLDTPSIGVLQNYKEALQLLLMLLKMQSYNEALNQQIFDRNKLLIVKKIFLTCARRNTTYWIWSYNMFGFEDTQELNKLHLWLDEYLGAFQEYLEGGISLSVFNSRYNALMNRLKKQGFEARVQNAYARASETLEEKLKESSPHYTELNALRLRLEQESITQDLMIEKSIDEDGTADVEANALRPSQQQNSVMANLSIELLPSNTPTEKTEWNEIIDLGEVFSYYSQARLK